MRRAVGTSFLFLCATIAALAAQRQTPPRAAGSSAPPASKSAANVELAGTVVDTASKAPLGGAIVMVTGAEMTHGRSVVTDSNGAFSVTGLPAGRFTITASKAAYLTSAYGAKAPGRQGLILALAAGQDRRDLLVPLSRGAVIAGTVTDENGAPVPDVTVYALPPTQTSAARPTTLGITDDRGRYRIFGLQPAKYFVVATFRTVGAGAAAMPSTSDVDRMLAELQRGPTAVPARPGATAPNDSSPAATKLPTFTMLTTFYPGTVSESDAEPVSLAVGEERTIDLTVQPVRSSTIEGTVRTGDGSPLPPQWPMNLTPVGPPLPLPITIGQNPTFSSDKDGAFAIHGVAAGKYVLTVRTTQGRGGSSTPFLWAETPITSTGDPISGVTLVLQPGMHFAGKLVFDGVSPPPANLSQVRVTLSTSLLHLSPGVFASAVSIGTLSGPAKADGTFDLPNIPPGPYTVNAVTASSWRIVSAIVNGRDVMDTPLEFDASDIAGATLHFVDKHVDLTGTLITPANAPATEYSVVLLPADATLWRPNSRRIQSTRPASDGHYAFHDVPAGDYLIAALTDVTPEDLADPAFLAQIAPMGVKVVLKDDASTVQDLRITGR